MFQNINYYFRGNGAILTYHRVLPDSIVYEDSILNIAVSKTNFTSLTVSALSNAAITFTF
jgi:hypothetical protein